MFPDFPKIKERFRAEYSKYLQKLTRDDPLFAGIKEERHFEGDRMSHRPEVGEKESTYTLHSSELIIKKEEVIEKGPQAFFEKIQGIADEIKKKKAELLFKTMNDVTKETGNIVDAKGKPFEFDSFYEMIEKIWIDFDMQGKPKMPLMVIPPQMGNAFMKKIAEWELNPDYKKRLDELFERKRKLWNDRESNRKLVD